MFYANRDDPKADFFETYDINCAIYWQDKDEDGSGLSFSVAIHHLFQPGCEPTNDWGRPIGEPCPIDDEDDGDDEIQE